MALLVSIVHSGAMIAAGGLCAWLVYRYLGLKFVARSWLNLETTWAATLILIGAISLAFCLVGPHCSAGLGCDALCSATASGP